MSAGAKDKQQVVCARPDWIRRANAQQWIQNACSPAVAVAIDYYAVALHYKLDKIESPRKSTGSVPWSWLPSRACSGTQSYPWTVLIICP
eukprot:1158687-Pelagomonas_calceolata.AAC.8